MWTVCWRQWFRGWQRHCSNQLPWCSLQGSVPSQASWDISLCGDSSFFSAFSYREILGSWKQQRGKTFRWQVSLLCLLNMCHFHFLFSACLAHLQRKWDSDIMVRIQCLMFVNWLTLEQTCLELLSVTNLVLNFICDRTIQMSGMFLIIVACGKPAVQVLPSSGCNNLSWVLGYFAPELWEAS